MPWNSYAIETSFTAPKLVSRVFRDGVCISLSVPTLVIGSLSAFTQWTSTYYPDRNTVIICKYGLSGGGGCSSSNSPQMRSNSAHNILNKIHLNESTKDLSLNLHKPQANDQKEAQFRKLLQCLNDKIKSGLSFSYVIKQIEDIDISQSFQFYDLANTVLEILALEELYVKKKLVFHREKIVKFARRLLILQLAYSEEEPRPGQYEISQVALSRIHVNMSMVEEIAPETGLYLNIKCVEALLEAIKYEKTSGHLLANSLRNIIEDYTAGKNSAKSVTNYMKNSVKSSRNLICDMIFLEFLGKHDNQAGVIKTLMDINCNLPWEHSAIALDYVISFFSPVECIKFLGEYLYFSSFEIEVWRVKSRTIEILLQYQIMHDDAYVQLIDIILQEKSNGKSEAKVEVQLKYLEVYKESVKYYLKYEKSINQSEKLKVYPRSEEIVNKAQEVDEIFMIMKSKPLAITGPRGIGKTNLALSYIKNKLSFYKKIFFIRASSQNLIINDFIKISKRLSLIDQDSLENTIETVIRYFNRTSEMILLVFDEASCLDDIKSYFPNGSILITSTDSNWELRYELTNLTREELENKISKMFPKKYLNEPLINLCNGCWRRISLVKLYQIAFDLDEVNLEKDIYEIIFRKVIGMPGCEILLLCMAALENFSVPITLVKKIYEVIGKGSAMDLENILVYLGRLKVFLDIKFSVRLTADFYRHFQGKLLENTEYISVVSQALHDFTVFDIFLNDKASSRLGRLVKVSVFSNSLGLHTGSVYFLAGRYLLQYQKSHKSALFCFEKSAQLLQNSPNWSIAYFGSALCHLHLRNNVQAIEYFTNLKSNSSEILQKLSIAHLVKAYEDMGKGIDVRDILFDPSTNLKDFENKECAHYIIHGICRLYLTEKKLKNLIVGFSPFLHSTTPSISLLTSLFRLSFYFANKERWTTVLAYINRIAALLHLAHLLQPSTLHSTLLTIIQLVNEIQVKIEILTGESHLIVSFTHAILAKVYATKQENELRKINLHKALEIRVKTLTSHHFSVAEVQYELAKYYGIKLKNTEYARSFLSQAEKTVKEITGENNILYAKIIEMKGAFCVRERNFVTAGELLHSSFELKLKILENSPDNEEISQGYAVLGKYAYKSGNFVDALAYYLKALEPDHKIYLSSFWAAEAYKTALKLKDFKVALDFKTQQIRMLMHLYEPNSNLIFNMYQKAYQLAVDIHSYEQANTIALASLDILRRISDSNEIEYNESMYLIKVADSFVKLRKFEEAQEYLIEAVILSETKYGIRSKEYINAKCAIGVFYKEIKKYAKAIVELGSVIDLLEGIPQARIFTDIGLCYMKKKCIDEAGSAFSNALKIYKEAHKDLEVGRIYILFSYLYQSDQFFTCKYLKKAIAIYNKELGPEHEETVRLTSKLSASSVNSTSIV